ncbi:hypothetical protein C8R44DRAFT_168091 [Mycena epipterygia]|nr:hypothetical protein C8R44DRAFT_168091 [Mycena epipterygia]
MAQLKRYLHLSPFPSSAVLIAPAMTSNSVQIQSSQGAAPFLLWINVLEIWVVTFLYGALLSNYSFLYPSSCLIYTPGIYCILFARCVYILLNRIRQLERQGILLLAMIVLFLLSTAQVFVLTVKSAVVVGESRMALDGLSAASLLIYVTSGLCSDALLIYRCYVVWGDNPYVVVPPLILLINSTAFGYTRNVTIIRIISLTTAVSVTLLTVSRVAWSAFKRRRMLTPELRQKYISATSAILESGLLYTLAVSIHFTLFSRGSSAEPVVFSAVSQIVGIAPTLIIVRAGVEQRKTTKMSMSMSVSNV